MSDELHTYIEPELEARMVALVLGEASAFEAEEMERLAAEKPELAIFKRRIEAVHGLVREAVQPAGDALKLSPERRAKVLAKIGEAPREDRKVVAARSGESRWPRRLGLIAAVLVLGLVMAGLILSGAGYAQKKAARSSGIADSRRYDPSADAPVPSAAATPEAATKALADLRRQLNVDDSSLVAQNEEGPQILGRLESSAGGRQMGRSGDADSPFDAIAPKPAEAPPFSAMASLGKDLSSTPALEGARFAESAPSDNLAVASESKSSEPASESFGELEKNAEPARVEAWALNYRQSGEKSVEDGMDDLMETDKTAEGRGAGRIAAIVAGSVVATGQSGDRGANLGEGLMVLKRAKQEANKGDESEPVEYFLLEEEQKAMSSKDRLTQEVVNFGTVPDDRKGKPDGLSRTRAPQAELPRLALGFALPVQVVQETLAQEEPFSTFSLHVSDVSFKLAQAALERGEMPEADRIRPEEFYNAFDYGDPSPAPEEDVACRIEQSAHPVMQQRNLVRIALRVGSTGRAAGQPLRLTILLDTSGSMEREDRAASVQKAMGVLASLLGPQDRVTLIGFARQPRLLAEDVAGNDAQEIVRRVAQTPSDGGTNLEEALKLASDLAGRHFDPAAQNRVVLLTDGAANLGNAKPVQLASMIGALRQRGIAFDACGVGANGLNDEMLESLTRKGDGRYYFLDTPEDADEGFARQLAGAFRPAAENVKVQVRWNPLRVGKYRLVGFEKHRLRKEDFRNDQVDAAELAAEEAAVALYQVEVLPEGEGELGDVFVRYRDASSGRMIEQSWTIGFQSDVPAFDEASGSMQLAGVAAMMAEKLAGTAVGSMVQLDELAPVVNQVRGKFSQDARVQELVRMFGKLRGMEK